MNTNDIQQASTPDADICGEVRTNCGQDALITSITNGILSSLRDGGSNLRSNAFSCIVPGVRLALNAPKPAQPAPAPSERPTPRTDAFQLQHGIMNPAKLYDHARQLERELAEAIRQKEAFQQETIALSNKLAEAREQRDRLADALRKLDDLGPPSKARSIIYEVLAAVKETTNAEIHGPRP